MTISYIKDTESKAEYIERKFKKTGSTATKSNLFSHIQKFEQYCEYGLKLDSEIVIQDLAKDWAQKKDVSSLVNLLHQFHLWIQEDHPEVIYIRKCAEYTFKAAKPDTQRNSMGIIRLYLRARTGIRISAEDMSEKITIPVDQNEREEYPLTLEQFKQIYDKTTILRRKVKYLFMRDTGCRTIESIQITKKMIEFDYDKSGIARVKIPKRIVKGKTKGRLNFLTPEAAKMVKKISNDLDENSPIFVDPIKKGSTQMSIKSNELHAFYHTRETLVKEGFSVFAAKHDSGTSKIVLHSVRAFTATAYSQANGEGMGHGYIGHKKYLEQYIRRSESEQLEMFKKAIPYLTGITKEYGPDEISQKQKGLENQVNLLQRQLSEEKKNSIQAVKTKVDNSSKFEYVVKYLISENRLSLEELAELMSKAPNVAPAKQ